MPSFLAFLPCEKVIESKDGNLSLLSIIDTLDTIIPEPSPLTQPKTLSAFDWHIIAMWNIDPSEVGVEFEQRISLKFPGTHTRSSTLIFAGEPGKNKIRNIVRVSGMPVSEHAEVKLSLAIRPNDGSSKFATKAHYSILIRSRRPNETEIGMVRDGA